MPRPTGLGETRRPALPPSAADQPSPGDDRPLLRWPLTGPVSVSRAFERPATPFGPGHRGADLAAMPGVAIHTAAGGTASFAGPVAGRTVVSIDHGGVRTTYEPLRPTVARGAVVQPGETIGWLEAGHPGCPAAACLHWGLLRDAEYLDPLASFQRVPPRLLPIGPG